MKRYPGDYSGLTVRQADLLSFLRSEQAVGRTPSFQEMCGALGLASRGGVSRLLVDLEERGYLERMPNRARAIRVFDKPRALDGKALGQYPIQALFAELKRRGVILEASRL